MVYNPYSPITWQNDQSPDIDEDNLNRIEYGIAIIHRLTPAEQGTPAMTLQVSSGVVFFTENPVYFAGGNTPTVTAPTANPRIDLLTINSGGTLEWTTGNEAASPSPPSYPTDKIPICEIYNYVGETSIKNVDDSSNGYIYRDVRSFVGPVYADLPATKLTGNFDVDANGCTTINNTTDEAGWLNIYGKDADALILGDATHEGGDISIYRDTSGNKQLYVDADAASNAIAMSVYGGVVAQHYLTVGQAALNTTYPLYVIGNARISESLVAIGLIRTPIIQPLNANDPQLVHNIVVSGTDAIDHAVKLQIDFNDVIVAQATGDGAGGITNKAIGLFGVTPQVQQAHIADADGTLADITTKFNQLKADIEGFGFNASS